MGEHREPEVNANSFNGLTLSLVDCDREGETNGELATFQNEKLDSSSVGVSVMHGMNLVFPCVEQVQVYSIYYTVL